MSDEGASKLALLQSQMNSRFQHVLDKLTPKAGVRWGIFAFVVVIYFLRVRALQVSAQQSGLLQTLAVQRTCYLSCPDVLSESCLLATGSPC